MPQEGGYGKGATEKFWRPFKIGSGRDQPGNPHAEGEKRLPSESTTLSPQKAKKILKHGEVRGRELTKPQKGFLGAVAGKARKK